MRNFSLRGAFSALALLGSLGFATAAHAVPLYAIDNTNLVRFDSSAPGNITTLPITGLPGQTTRTVAITVYGDTIVESNKTLSLNLSNAQGATLSRNSVCGTVTNDD